MDASNTSTVSSQFTVTQVEMQLITSPFSVTLPGRVFIDGIEEPRQY
ncbi:hypothetical protein [Vibrio methylphosphonaticus]|nr:hypothetical protein [Vibrio methylphosphonaticus]MCL9774006.1 hypothetical protein [Vibrio methylphosphonaticus]